MYIGRLRASWLAAAITACFVSSAAAVAAAPLVSAVIEPRQIALGESAQLTITSSGNGMEAPNLPKVAGLEFRVVGQSRRVQIINGVTLATTSVIVRVIPQVAGIFTIPGITSQPLLLRVSPDNGSGSSTPYGTSNPNRRPPVTAGGLAANGVRMTADGAAFVRLNLPKRDVYVGESIPVEIEVGMRAGMVSSVNGLPTLTGSDFTLNNLSRQPERVEKVIDGQPFTLLTWHSVLAPVKPGVFTLSVETPLTVRIRTRPQKDSMIDDLLGDPFLQNVFGATVPKDVTVASPAAELTVLALPMEGRPRDFSGAVGVFKIASDISSTTAAVGDPLTLRMKISGAGNFDRVDSPMLERLEHWKTYPPKSNFTHADAVGYKGEKTFEQPLIASQPGSQTLPALTFNYFDPTTRRYESARASPLGVTISPGLADSTPGAAAYASNDGGPAAGSAALRPDHANVFAGSPTLVPLYFRPAFVALPSLLTLLFAGGWLGLQRSRVQGRTDPGGRGRRLSKEATRALKQMEAAATANDAARFFVHARGALQTALAARWQMAPAEITTADIDARLHGDGAADVLRVFALADEASYAGRPMSSPDFARWMTVVREQYSDEKLS
jgi:hypothetical protein